jgi:effector-binding domain-containing protein
VPAVEAAAIIDIVAAEESVAWLHGALGELHATLAARNAPDGRVISTLIPAAELAVIEHRGPPADVDRANGILAAYVARHALAVAGPIREYYLVGQHDTPDTAQWRTEIGWPIFQTSSA